MTGGAISGNYTSASGGVYVGGRFTVSGSPVVSGNTNSAGTANNVYLPNNKKIAVGNLTAGASIGVTVETSPALGSSVTITTGASAGCEAYFTSDDPALLIYVANGELRLGNWPNTPWGRLQAQLSVGGVITLTNDVSAAAGDTPLKVETAVVLDLAGYTIRGNGSNEVFRILSGGDLTLTNSIPETGAIIGGNASYGGGVYVNSLGTFTMVGGAISGNSANSYGGGVYVAEGWSPI